MSYSDKSFQLCTVCEGLIYFSPLSRMVQGHLQDFGTLSSYMRQFTDDQFLLAMSDFHVLLYIAAMDMLPLRVSNFCTLS